MLGAEPLVCLLLEVYFVLYGVSSQPSRPREEIDTQRAAELLFNVVLDASEKQSFIQLSEMLNCYVLKQTVSYVIPLKLLLGSSKHPLDRVERRRVLRDGECQELSLFKEIPDGIMLMDPGVIKKEHELLSYELPFILVEFFKGLLEV